MNNYLMMLGSNFSEIRQLLNLTQEDLAIKMGVSRPTIVKIEQDPSRLTKSVAFAFFVAISYEMKKRIMKVKEIDPKSFKDQKALKKFMDVVKISSLLPVGTIVTTAALGLSAIPGIGAAIATAAGINWGLKAMKNKDSDQSNLKWDEEKAKKVLEEVQKKLLEDQNRLLSYLQLKSLDVLELVEKINENEITNKEGQ